MKNDEMIDGKIAGEFPHQFYAELFPMRNLIDKKLWLEWTSYQGDFVEN